MDVIYKPNGAAYEYALLALNHSAQPPSFGSFQTYSLHWFT